MSEQRPQILLANDDFAQYTHGSPTCQIVSANHLCIRDPQPQYNGKNTEPNIVSDYLTGNNSNTTEYITRGRCQAMATPSTPQSQLSQSATATPSPGLWRHPRFEEIASRQKANTFNDSNLRRIIYNSAFLIALFILSTQYAPSIPPPNPSTPH